MGASQSALQPLTPDEQVLVREYSVYIALMLALSHSSKGASNSDVKALTAEEIIRMMQARRPLPAPQAAATQPQWFEPDAFAKEQHSETHATGNESDAKSPSHAGSQPTNSASDADSSQPANSSDADGAMAAALRVQRVARGHLARRRARVIRRRRRGNDSNRQEILFSSERDKHDNLLVEHPGRLRVRQSSTTANSPDVQWDA